MPKRNNQAAIAQAMGLPAVSAATSKRLTKAAKQGEQDAIEREGAKSVKSVLKAIGNDHLDLVRGNGYWYFVYDDLANNRYDTYSVYTMHLGGFTVEQWAADGRAFVARMENDK